MDGGYLETQIRQQGVEAVPHKLAKAEQDETQRVLADTPRAGENDLKKAPEEVWNQAMGHAGIALRASRAHQKPRFDPRFPTLPSVFKRVDLLKVICHGLCLQPRWHAGSRRLWDVACRSEVCRWQAGVNLLCCAFGPDGKKVIASDHRRGVHFLSLVRR
jgi:hypothetical protein